MGGGGPYISAGTGGSLLRCRFCARRGDALDLSFRRGDARDLSFLRFGLRRRGDVWTRSRLDCGELRWSGCGIGGGRGGPRSVAPP